MMDMVPHRVGEDRIFLNQLERRRAQLIVHILGHDSLSKRVIERKIVGKNIKKGHNCNFDLGNGGDAMWQLSGIKKENKQEENGKLQATN